MRLKHYPFTKLKKEIRAAVSKYLDPKEYKVFFFGSRVAGRGSERSDIDIGIFGSNPIPFSTMRKIKDKIEKIHTLYKIDMVDFQKTDSAFREVALQNTEKIT